MNEPTFQIRAASDTPFYCKPLALFFVEWLLMLAAFQLRISFASFPDLSVAVLLFVIASLSFLFGYGTLKTAYAALHFNPLGISPLYRVHLQRLRRFHLVSIAVVLAIMYMNFKRFGPPPILAIFGADTLSYQDYGALRQPMFTAILAIFIAAPLEPSTWRRWLLYIFSPICFLVYGSRGYLLIMLFQALAVFSLRTRKSKSFIYATAGVTLVSAVLVSNLIGNNRNSLGVDALLGYLQIKQRYQTWPAAYLWVISYISTPFSNMCWIVRAFQYTHPSFSFLYSALPGSFAVKAIEMTHDLGSEKIIDGVHTYMAKYFLDFWYFGIFGINYIWGLIAAAMQAGNRLTRNFLLSGVLLGCMAFMFFSDFLTILIILMEMVAAVVIQKFIVLPVVQEGNGDVVPESADLVR